MARSRRDAARSRAAATRTEQAQNGFYLPFNWRGFHDFGTGLIGDWAIHIFGPANLALRLGSPTSVECVKQEGTSPFTFADRQHIRWEFPARAAHAAGHVELVRELPRHRRALTPTRLRE